MPRNSLILSLTILVLITGLWRDLQIRQMLLAALVIFGFGIWDDYKRLTPLPKLIGQLVAAVFLVMSGVSIQILESHTFFVGGSGMLFVWLDRFLTIFWIVGVTNAFNLVDSMDGLAVGLSGWAFAFFMLATMDSGQQLLSVLSAILVGFVWQFSCSIQIRRRCFGRFRRADPGFFVICPGNLLQSDRQFSGFLVSGSHSTGGSPDF